MSVLLFLASLRDQLPQLANHFGCLYPATSYGPAAWTWRRVAHRVRELCEKSGLRDRLPRPILPGNKRIVEWLADEACRLELEGVPRARIWAHRKAAWAIEDLEQDIGLVYRSLGLHAIMRAT